MSRREDVDNAIWGNEEFLDLNPHAKLVYFWSFTNPRCGMAGLYPVPQRFIEAETKLDSGELEAAIAELAAAQFLFYDGRVLWVRTRVKHLRSRSWTIAKAVHKDLKSVGTHPYVDQFLATYSDQIWLKLSELEGVSIPPPGPLEGVHAGSGRGSSSSSSSEERARDPKFRGKKIPDDRLHACLEVFDKFTAKAGTSARPFKKDGGLSDGLSRIVGAFTDDDRWTVDVASRAIDAAFADPFWTSPPTPGVVFGDKVRERYLEAGLKPQLQVVPPARSGIDPARLDGDEFIAAEQQVADRDAQIAAALADVPNAWETTG